jgi:hypothetical protein
MNAGGMEGLVRIDVAESRDRCLIEQERFDRPASSQDGLELPDTKLQRFGSQRSQLLPDVFRLIRQAPHAAETPGIAKPQLSIRFPDPNPQVRVIVNRRTYPGHGQRAGHAQMEDELPTTAQVHHDALGPPMKSIHAPPAQEPGQRPRIAMNDVIT